MLADALSAEALRFHRNRAILFWGFLFVPLLALISGILGQMFMRGELPAPLNRMPVDMAGQVESAFGQAGGPMTILFALIAAAVLFAGDYRWETWRLLIPRAPRGALIGARIVLFALCSLATVVLIGAVSSLVSWSGAAASGAPVQFQAEPAEFARRLAAHAAISWLQLLQAGGVAALAAVVARSMLGALMTAIGLMIGLAFAQLRLPIEDPAAEFWKLWLIPGHAFEYGRMFLAGVEPLPGQAVGLVTGLSALWGIALWLLLGFGGAAAAFARQDLSKE